MSRNGPHIETLLRRLSECPRELLELSESDRGAEVVLAIVADYFRDLEFPLEAPTLGKIQRYLGKVSPNARATIAVTVWLLADHPFTERVFIEQANRPVLYRDILTSQRLQKLAELIRAEWLVNDPDRREELARIVLSELDLTPAGETKLQAEDRLNTLDSIERQRVLSETLAAEKRAREVREAMARRQALESASRYGE